MVITRKELWEKIHQLNAVNLDKYHHDKSEITPLLEIAHCEGTVGATGALWFSEKTRKFYFTAIRGQALFELL